jgi:hypothetical protein
MARAYDQRSEIEVLRNLVERSLVRKIEVDGGMISPVRIQMNPARSDRRKGLDHAFPLV